MNITFSELIVLSQATDPKTRARLADEAAALCGNPQYDRRVALKDIKSLEGRGLLRMGRDAHLETTSDGRREVIDAWKTIDKLRNAMTYQVRG